jgi:hypothetical protein
MSVVLLLVDAADQRLRAVYTYGSAPAHHPVPDGCALHRWPLPDAPPLERRQNEYRVVLDAAGAVIGVRHDPPPPDLPALRARAAAQIDDVAARFMEHVRPAAAARIDPDRLRQAELALASADEYVDAYPLLGGAGSLHERARMVLAAAQATAERLAAMDVARRDAKTRIRAATTTAEIAAVTLEIPQ